MAKALNTTTEMPHIKFLANQTSSTYLAANLRIIARMGAISAGICSILKTYSRIAPTERGGYRLARLARSLIGKDQWSKQWTTPAGLHMKLNLATYPDCCMVFGLYELDTTRQMRRLLRPGDWFVDCGANIGYFTLLMARHVGATGQVDAFEPDPMNRATLLANLKSNALDTRVRAHDLALGNHGGMVDLFHPTQSKSNHGMSSLYPDGSGLDTKFSVQIARLDDVLKGVPNLVKIDIEGAELAAIEGMSRMLQSPNPPSLIVEHNPASCASAGHLPSDLMRLLQRIQPRYRVFFIDWKLQPIISPNMLDHMPRQGNLLITPAA